MMGFWGWPLEQPEKATLACRAALAISSSMGFQPVSSASSQHGLDAHATANFRLGIGIASGPAVAGQIGTADQAKVTVFGPVVNLAARLEAMTRRLGADILLDDTTATEVSCALADGGRLRRLATLVLHGLQTPLVVNQLLPTANLTPELSAAALDEYDQALGAFTSGRWEDARRRLNALAAIDGAAAFLLEYMSKENNQSPPNFDGVIRMTTK